MTVASLNGSQSAQEPAKAEPLVASTSNVLEVTFIAIWQSSMYGSSVG